MGGVGFACGFYLVGFEGARNETRTSKNNGKGKFEGLSSALLAISPREASVEMTRYLIRHDYGVLARDGKRFVLRTNVPLMR